MSTHEANLPGSNRVCPRCIDEPFLKKLIKTKGAHDFCSYCDHESATYSIEELADLVEKAFGEHYVCTATEPDGWEYAMHSDPEIDYDWERAGEAAKWAIMNAAEVSEEIAEDIRSLLEDRHYDHEDAKMGQECPFSKEAHYAGTDADHGEFLMLWRDFENELKTKARFFAPSAKSILDRIFAGVCDLQTTEKSPVVVAVGPDTTMTTLYRARVFAGQDEKLKQALAAPWTYLGTPPKDAAGAGRMNARGIAVFYGANDAETALSEVRPPVGSKVALATFNIVRPLRLLDLSALKSVACGGSIFDPDTIVRMQRGNFLEVLSHLLSRAVMPHEQASEFLPTQVVAEYLANEVRLDGIVFPSVQTGGDSANVVLFHHAARVEEVKLPEGTEVDVQLETIDSDGVSPDYWIWEKVPPPVTIDEAKSLTFPLNAEMFQPFDEEFDNRPSTLRIDTKTIRVHHVRAVTFETKEYSVNQHRIEHQ